MRHGAVSYFDDDGAPVDPEAVSLTTEGRAQAEAARDLLEPIAFDRVIASGLPRTIETASIVAPGREPEAWPELDEIRGERLSAIPADELENEFVHAFRGVVPNEKRFLGGETIGELFDRVIPAVDRLLADEKLGHGAARPARCRQPGDSLARAHRAAHVPRPVRTGAGVRQRPRRRRRRLDRPGREREPVSTSRTARRA